VGFGPSAPSHVADESVADTYTAVSFMTAHPSLLVDPALLERSIRASELNPTP